MRPGNKAAEKDANDKKRGHSHYAVKIIHAAPIIAINTHSPVISAPFFSWVLAYPDPQLKGPGMTCTPGPLRNHPAITSRDESTCTP